MRKLLSVIMATTLVTAQGMPIFAEETVVDPGKSEAVLTQQATNFNATVPAQLPVDIDEYGIVSVATDVKLINNSNAPIKVVSIDIDSQNGWLKVREVREKSGLKEYTLNVDVADKVVLGKQSTNIIYSSTVSPQIQATSEVMAHVNFLLDWDSLVDGEVTNPNFDLKADKTMLGISDTSTLTLTHSDASNITWENSNPEVAVIEDTKERSAINQKVVRALNLGTSIITAKNEKGEIATQTIAVVANELDRISVVTPPNKVIYTIGEVFDPAGLRLKAHYKLGQTYDLTYFDYSKEPLTYGQRYVELSYTEQGITKKTSVSIDTVGGELQVGTKYIENGYEYRYGMHSYVGNKNYWTESYTDGWGVVALNKNNGQTQFEQPLEEIMGKPVTHYTSLFGATRDIELIGEWSNKNVIVMQEMFGGYKGTELDLSNFKGPKVENIGEMFDGCSLTEIDLTKVFNGSKIKYLSGAFRDMESVQTIDISTLDLTNLESASDMLYRSKWYVTVYVKDETVVNKLYQLWQYQYDRLPSGLAVRVKA